MRSFGSIADTVESIVKPVWGGLRSVLGKEASSASSATFATPASFACVENNSSVTHPDEPVSHPTLGFRGVRMRVQQPYLDLVEPFATSGGQVSFLAFSNSVASQDGAIPPIFGNARGYSSFSWALNPVLLGGALAQKAVLYDRYVFRRITFEFTTTTTTTQLGSITMGIENDVARIAADDFSSLRMVVPSVTFPARIPQARLNFVYDGPELYYTLDRAPSGPGSFAQSRQQIQSVFSAGFSGGAPPVLNGNNTLGFLMAYIDIEFYDPIPPIVLLPAQESLLSGLRNSLHQRRIARKAPSVVAHAAAVEREVNLLTDKLIALSELTDEEALSPDFVVGDGSVSSAGSRITVVPDLPPGPALPAVPQRKTGFW